MASHELQKVLLCRQFHCLPNAGGLNDQDPWDIRLLHEVSTILSEKERIDNEKAAARSSARRKRH